MNAANIKKIVLYKKNFKKFIRTHFVFRNMINMIILIIVMVLRFL